ncbi:type IX secretion system protein PorQ [Bacteroidales bacterium OttesenSCG-928-I14]|nr:type IX secretion system protein PorQ [Bacteroidales bacterium OttesenSCG-928-I14]
MRKILFVLLLFMPTTFLFAQEGKTTFDYLMLPVSAHAAALGGTNVSFIEPDVSLVFNNPAFLGYEMDKQLNLNYMSYLGDIGMGNVAFGKSINDRTTIGLGVNYVNYGNMIETSEDRTVLGDLKANDITGNVFLSRDFTDYLRGGITAKFIYSNYHHNTSIGLGVDLGLSYYNPDTEFSWGIVAKNLGRQVKAYEDESANLPWDIQIGMSKKLSKAPIRFSFTGLYLKQWSFENPNGEKDSFFKTLAKHFIIGVDILPSDNFWIGVGYNIKRGMDMHLQEGNKFAGFSAGAGLKVRAFSFGISYAKYHPNANSLIFSLSSSFAELGL